MKDFFKKIPILGKYIERRGAGSDDWRDPKATLEVISKKELDALQNETINDLTTEGVVDPKALFYIHKYIDSKFNKKDFNVDERFINKANRLDQLYAEGKAEIYAEYTGYEELMERAKEADMRLRRAINALDPETFVSTEECKLFDDSDLLKEKFDKLADEIRWEEK